MKKAKTNIYALSSFLLLSVLLFSLANLGAKSKVSIEDGVLLAQMLAPIPGVGPTVCAANCGGNDHPTVSGSTGDIGSFCRYESDCKSGLSCVATRACTTGCMACTGSSVTTCQESPSLCVFRGRECSNVQGPFCCRGLTCVSRVIGNGRIESRCRRSCS